MRSVSITIRARYENGVLKPLQDIGLRDGEEVIVIIKRKPDIDRFIGVLGKASARELEAYEEEVVARAQRNQGNQTGHGLPPRHPLISRGVIGGFIDGHHLARLAGYTILPPL